MFERKRQRENWDENPNVSKKLKKMAIISLPYVNLVKYDGRKTTQQSVPEEYESQRLQEALAGRSFSNLPGSSISEEGCYMDMPHNLFEMKMSTSFNDANNILDRFGSVSPRPKYARSLSASSVDSNTVLTPAPREHSIQLESINVSAGNVLQDTIEVPFDNLLDFNYHSEDKPDTCPPLFANKPKNDDKGCFSGLLSACICFKTEKPTER